jgi:hypothetical protein
MSDQYVTKEEFDSLKAEIDLFFEEYEKFASEFRVIMLGVSKMFEDILEGNKKFMKEILRVD